MKQWLLDLFKDDSGVSMMRVLSLICVLTACGMAIDGAKNGRDVSGICATFLAAGIGGKVGQKVVEVKNG